MASSNSGAIAIFGVCSLVLIGFFFTGNRQSTLFSNDQGLKVNGFNVNGLKLIKNGFFTFRNRNLKESSPVKFHDKK